MNYTLISLKIFFAFFINLLTYVTFFTAAPKELNSSNIHDILHC